MIDRFTIDTHRHYLPSTMLDVFRERTTVPYLAATRPGEEALAGVIECAGNHRSPVLATMLDIDAQLAGMDEVGLDMAVLAGTLPGVDELPPAEAVAVARACNDELADLCRAHPDRLAALAVLPMLVPEAAAEELERAMALGLVGAQVFSNVQGEELYDERFGPVFDVAGARSIPLRIHPTVRSESNGVERYGLRGTLGHVLDSSAAALGLISSGLFDRYPDFRMVVPHVGGVLPYLMARCDYEAARVQRRLGDAMSATPPSEAIKKLYTDSGCSSPESLTFAIDRLGADHLMLGTDFPLWELGVTDALVADLDLDEDTAHAFHSGTAAALFGIAVTQDA